MKKIKMFSILIVLFAFSGINFGQELTLKEALNIAFKNNPELKIYKEKEKIAELKYKAAWGNFFPSLNFEGGFTRMNSAIELDLAPFRELIMNLQASNQVELRNIYSILAGNPSFTPAEKATLFKQYYGVLDSQIPSFNMKLKEQNYKNGRFTAVQPLFLGGKLIAYKNYRRAEREYSSFEKAKVKDELVNKIVTTYLKLKLIDNIIDVRKNAVRTIEAHKKQAEQLYEQGIISKVSITKAEVALAEANQKLNSELNNRKLLQLSLADLLGKDHLDSLSVSDEFYLKETQIDLKEALREAHQYQPVLQMVERKLLSADANYKIQRSDFLPTIAAFGMKEIYPEYLSVLEPKWAIGVQVKWNIFNGFKDYLELEEAEHIKKEAEYSKVKYRRMINLWVNKNYTDYKNAIDEYRSSLKTYELAKENLRINDKKFLAGMATSLEVIDAELSVEQAQISKYLSLYNYYYALTNLFTATGKPERILEYLD